MIPSLLPVLSHLLSPLRAAPARLGRLAVRTPDGDFFWNACST